MGPGAKYVAWISNWIFMAFFSQAELASYIPPLQLKRTAVLIKCKRKQSEFLKEIKSTKKGDQNK